MHTEQEEEIKIHGRDCHPMMKLLINDHGSIFGTSYNENTKQADDLKLNTTDHGFLFYINNQP